MKKSIVPAIGIACALALASALPLNAAADESDNMCAAIASEISQPGVCVSEDDGVVTLSGYVESAMDREAAERAALSHEGVSEVRNLISVSD